MLGLDDMLHVMLQKQNSNKIIHSKQIGFLKVLYRTMKVPYITLRFFRPLGVLQSHERVL